MLLQQFSRWLEAEKRYSKHTIQSYEIDLGQFHHFLQKEYGITDIKEVTPFIIKSWIIHLLDNQYKAASVNRKLVSVSSFFKYLIREGKIEKNPATLVKSLKKGKSLVKFASEKQMQELLGKNFHGDDFCTSRDKLIFELLYGTGIRLSELIGIEINDVSIAEGIVKVSGKRQKQRVIPLNPVLKASLAEYLKNREASGENEKALILTDKGKKAYPMFVYRRVKHYLSMVTSLDKRSPHLLRHTFATHLLNNGAEINAIKDLLGHSSLAATQVYTHTSIEQLKDIYKLAHPKAKK